MTAVKINEIAYSATDPMARTARIVNAEISLLDRARPEGGASVDAFPGAVSVVFADIQNPLLVGNELSRRIAIPARDLLRMELDRERGVASTDAVQARLEARERDSKYAPMYMTPNRIA